MCIISPHVYSSCHLSFLMIYCNHLSQRGNYYEKKS
nr:MAG TPA: hypothetical protein [Caudoviricetes sp.]